MERREVQEGPIKVRDVIDLIIEILRGSKTQKQVKECLIMGVDRWYPLPNQSQVSGMAVIASALRNARQRRF